MKLRILLAADPAVLTECRARLWKEGCRPGCGRLTATDSTSLANAQGSMESDGENFGQNQDAASDTSAAKKEERNAPLRLRLRGAIRADLVRPVIAEEAAAPRATRRRFTPKSRARSRASPSKKGRTSSAVHSSSRSTTANHEMAEETAARATCRR